MTVYRVLRTSKATLTRTFYLDEGAVDASGSVSVSVTRWDGTVVQGPVTASGPVDHAYSFTYDGSDVLDEVTVTWTATVGGDAIVLDQDVIQVVGGHFLGLGDLRNKIDPVFRNAERYPTQDLIDRRIEVEDEFERICGQAFVPRFAVDHLSGTGRAGPLPLKWPNLRLVRAVTVGGTALAVDAVAEFGRDPLGLLRRDAGWPYGTGNVVVEYEHGMDRPPPDIARVFKLRMKSLLLTTKSPLPDRAERLVTTEVGPVILARPTAYSTGISEVDAALDRWPSPRPGFG